MPASASRSLYLIEAHTLEHLDPLAFIRRQARSLARVAFSLANPTAKRR
jgi:hypothetical protein